MENTKKEKKKMTIKDWIDLLITVVIALSISLILFRCIIFHGSVPTQSMDPTIKTTSFIIGNRLPILFDRTGKNIKRYEVITFKSDEGDKNERLMVKRVIGLPGEHMKITETDIYVNGQKLRKDFVSSEDVAQMPDEFDIPEGCFFVAGDNRNNSYDSRKWNDKFVKKKDIKAKIIFNYWYWHIEKLKTYEDNIKKADI